MGKEQETDTGHYNIDKEQTKEVRKLFRRKPLLVEASSVAMGIWEVLEAGKKYKYNSDEFKELYEAVEMDDNKTIDAGLPDLAPGTKIEKDGKRLVRVSVIAGKGNIAYWFNSKPKGEDCEFKVIADTGWSDLPHYAGKFVDAYDGKPGGRSWIEVK